MLLGCSSSKKKKNCVVHFDIYSSDIKNIEAKHNSINNKIFEDDEYVEYSFKDLNKTFSEIKEWNK